MWYYFCIIFNVRSVQFGLCSIGIFFLSFFFFSITIGIFLDRLERFIGWQGRVRESPANEHSVISSRFIPLLFTRSICNYQTDSWWDLFSLKPALTFKNVFAKFNFSPAFFEKIPSFISFVFKIGNKWILKQQICILKKQADLKTNCTRLWRFILMITYNTLTQKYYFC